MGMIPASALQKSVTPFADAAAIIFGPGAVYWVGGGVAIAAFGTLNGFILIPVSYTHLDVYKRQVLY